ncbi:unnamed protein product [Rhizophagus irregularis]|nr:unnamed protein product [Rhizophagus irregularis]
MSFININEVDIIYEEDLTMKIQQHKQNAQSSSSKKWSKKAIVINSYTEDHDDNHDIALREREADIRIME